MAGERLIGIVDRGTLLAESIIDNTKVLHTLIADGQNKDTFLKQVVSKLGNGSTVQACFLRTIFQNIAKEGDLKVTNRRDTAMAILTDTSSSGEVSLNVAIAPLVKDNSTVVYDAYIEAVQEQTRDNDVFSGSVDALLEVGKAIAPHLNQDAQERKKIIDAWEETAEKFHTGDQPHIRSKLEEIKKAMSPNSILDLVEKLRKQGLSNPQIAKQLERKLAAIEKSASRLIAAGRIEASPKGRAVFEATIQLDSDVEQLRKQGLSNPQIAEQLGRKRTDIKESAHRLIAAGRIERLRRYRVIQRLTS